MAKILITGNGFDLSLGLPTSYADFINILNHISDSEAFTFSEIYSKSNSYSVIESNFNFFKVDILKIKNLKTQLLHNWWFDFFKDEYRIETWIDFENKIEYVLKILFSSIDYLRKNIFAKGSLRDARTFFQKSIFDSNIEIIQVLKKFGAIEYDGNNILLSEKYLIKKYGYYIDIDIEAMTRDLNHSLLEFKIIFNYYFEIFIFPLYDQLKLPATNTFFNNVDRHYTFNYTPTFEKLYGKSGVTNYLHGKINSKDNQIVLGINDVPTNVNVDKKYFIPFTKYFQKLNNDTDYVFIKEYDDYTSENYTFFFWGHSLDKSDEDYINEVFDFINNLKSIKKIVIIYHTAKAKAKLLTNIIDIRGKKDISDLMRNKILILEHIDSPHVLLEMNKDLTRQFYF